MFLKIVLSCLTVDCDSLSLRLLAAPVVKKADDDTNVGILYLNTYLQVGSTLASPVFGYVDHPALQALCAATAISTVASAVSYLVSKDTYKFLKNKS